MKRTYQIVGEIEEDLPELWHPESAASLSILLTPIFGAWIHKKNWETLNERSNAKESAAFMYLGIILFGFIIFTDTPWWLNYAYLVFWYLFHAKVQFIHVNGLSNGYLLKSWAKPVSIALSIIILFCLVAWIACQIEDCMD